MNIQKWHYGKLAILWAWGILIALLIVRNLESIENYILGLLLIAVLGIILIVLTVISWKWLGGKEQ